MFAGFVLVVLGFAILMYVSHDVFARTNVAGERQFNGYAEQAFANAEDSFTRFLGVMFILGGLVVMVAGK